LVDTVYLDDNNKPDPSVGHCEGRARLVAATSNTFTYHVVQVVERSGPYCYDGSMTLTYVTPQELNYRFVEGSTGTASAGELLKS
jgi:hypothetical protein